MDVFLLGAGKPALGRKPSALKNIAPNTRAMDWQIRSFETITESDKIHYLGGYYVDDVIESYPQLNFTVIPDWEQRSILHTFLKAPFTNRPVIVAYSDTIFRKEILSNMLSIDADIVFCVDSLWRERYESRTTADIQTAETILIDSDTGVSVEMEFTGLIHFSQNVTSYLSKIDESAIGTNLIHLLDHLKSRGFYIKPFDVTGHWAEFNSPRDIAKFILGTKAETLARLEPLVKMSHIGKQISFTTAHWKGKPESILDEITNRFAGANIIVRSSSKDEDNWNSSKAGSFQSLPNIDINDKESVSSAIETVIDSYGTKQFSENQILIQHFLSNVRAAGVVFTCNLETGAPYYRFNFDDKTQSTESVTTGSRDNLRTIIVSKFAADQLQKIESDLVPVLIAVQELEQVLNFDKLDVEFAIDKTGLVHIFQVRPITVDHSEYEFESKLIENSLKNSVSRFCSQQTSSPIVKGHKTLFTNMSDWNPAEIIGIHPKPFALSLYKHLITNDIWSQQRAEFGYCDVRPNPLILSFSGQPYVDTRLSFNSFIPATLPEDTATRLATAYINILADYPLRHDKIEFDVAFTIWTPDIIEKASARLIPYGVTAEDLILLEGALKIITCKAFLRLQEDINPIKRLNKRRLAIESSKLSTIDKIYLLLNDCKQFGTLPFSHAARAGFVATTLLNNLVTNEIISDKQRLSFLNSIKTVASNLEKDRHAYNENKLSQQELIKKYGHLRPGTYEITSPAYWEDPSHYFFSDYKNEIRKKPDFMFSVTVKNELKKILNNLGSSLSVKELTRYLAEAIQARELVKFEFTKNISRALDLCIELGKEIGVNREELSYLEYHDLEQLKLNDLSIIQLRELIKTRKQQYSLTCAIELPSLIQNKTDFYCFERFIFQPNFVTLNRVEASVKQLNNNKYDDLHGKVILISQADPGFEWLFGCGISGLITQYGGANSHMAIRAAELNLPAAIGIGEKLYEKIASMKRVELDCANQTIRELK